jgi:hypothetical protein
MFIMEMIENIAWLMTGFVSTFVAMELAWRLARRQTRGESINRVAVKEVRSQ